MALVYATHAELVAWLAPTTAPADTTRVRREASREVRQLTLACIYDTDATGLPTDAEVLQAFKDATCAQAAWAIGQGDAEGDGSSPFSEMSIGSIKLKRATATDSTSATQVSGEAAYEILQDAGIVPAEPWAC